MHRPAVPSAHTRHGWRSELIADGRRIHLEAPTRPPSRNVIAASWNGGIGPAAVESNARNDHVSMAEKPIRVGKVRCTRRPQASTPGSGMVMDLPAVPCDRGMSKMRHGEEDGQESAFS